MLDVPWLTAEIEASAGGSDGVIITRGGRFSGWELYRSGSKPVFHDDLAGVERYVVSGEETQSCTPVTSFRTP